MINLNVFLLQSSELTELSNLLIYLFTFIFYIQLDYKIQVGFDHLQKPHNLLLSTQFIRYIYYKYLLTQDHNYNVCIR